MVGHLVRRDDIIVEVRNLDLSIVGQIHPDDLDVQVTDVLSGVGACGCPLSTRCRRT